MILQELCFQMCIENKLIMVDLGETIFTFILV